jgi:hypothetical protein
MDSPWLNTRDAARYVGYHPGEGPLARDPQIRCFYAWALSRGVTQQPGRAVYSRADLDAAISGQPATTPALERMRQLARQDVADRRRRARIALKVRRPLVGPGP